ncbi:uncharacterized protein PFL1_00126 [Pseudozyma flocculosa PF-1]|uniref:DNA damage-binding protein CMR1 n=1 Tax=Pseudozyma flocculosa TaxID=84751 RepID=A0A5C3ETJ9_9BASI|nr:uncharacterized protein PFL1_00126 [Pseudozyma flocculosa PF-1]EPQ31927.1 hypothetical protein PFL1_00126 [Pseudozyma flocculosa PF-1]SPO35160.1 related to WD repeat-containing protein UM00675 [Pseudozyma flocculosa]
MNEATDYEQERLRNIRENEALMRELGVLHGSETIGAPRRRKPAPGSAKPRAKRSGATPTKREKAPTRVQPSRSSARLAGHEADSEAVKRKYEKEAEEARIEAERAKRARHGQHDLATMTGGELEAQQIKALEDTLAGLASNMAKAAELVDVGDEKKQRSDAKSAPRSELEAVLNRMKLRSAAKVTQRRVYSMAYHPTTDKDLVFVGDKEGSIGIWDAAAPRGSGAKEDDAADEDEDEKQVKRDLAPKAEAGTEPEADAGDDGDDDDEGYVPEGKAWSLQVHGRSPVTSLKLDPVSASTLFSASYDSTIRRLDLATQQSTEVWAGQDDVLLSVFDVLSPSTHASAFTATPNPSLDERSIWIADHRGGLLHIDLREGRRRGNATSRRWQVCEKKIGAMSVNRLAPHCIATASLDQHIRLFDVRALSALPETNDAPYTYKNVDGDELDTVHAEAQFAAHKARQACTSVDFSPRGDQLLGVSYDDVVKVWDLHPTWLYSRRGVETRKKGPAAQGAAPKAPEARGGGRVLRRSRSGRFRSAHEEDEDEEEGQGEEEGEDDKAAIKVEDEVKPEAKPTRLLSWFRSGGRTKKEAVKMEPEQQDALAVEEEKSKLEAVEVGEDEVKDEDEDEVEVEGRPTDLLGAPTTIPHNNQTGKWLTLFRARWHANAGVEPHFSIGSMTRRAEIYAADGTLLRALWDPEVVTAVPAVTVMHPLLPGKLATGNASGRCTFWDAE